MSIVIRAGIQDKIREVGYAATKGDDMTERKKSVETDGTKEGEVIGETLQTNRKTAPWPLVTVGVFAVVVMVAFLVVCWWAIAAAMPSGPHASDMPGRFGYGNDDSGFERRERRELWNAAEASGVVTKINGDTITISGRGKQLTITRTDDTVVGGDKEEVAVNDTVLVYGDTEDDGSVTASRIVVRNEIIMEEDARSGHMIRKPDA